MKTLIISDIHGAYNDLKNLLDTEDFDRIISLGDQVGYLKDGQKVIELLRIYNAVIIKGNHEEMFVNGRFDNCCSHFAKQAFGYAFPSMSVDYVRWIDENLSQFYFEEGTLSLYIHAFVSIKRGWIYSDFSDMSKYSFDEMIGDLCNYLSEYISSSPKIFEDVKKRNRALSLYLGHTHSPVFLERWNGPAIRVVNPGAFLNGYYAIEENSNIQFKRMKMNRVRINAEFDAISKIVLEE